MNYHSLTRSLAHSIWCIDEYLSVISYTGSVIAASEALSSSFSLFSPFNSLSTQNMKDEGGKSEQDRKEEGERSARLEYKVPMLLSGELRSMFSHQAMAQRKELGVQRFLSIFPEFGGGRIVFVGDNGQGDLDLSKRLLCYPPLSMSSAHVSPRPPPLSEPSPPAPPSSPSSYFASYFASLSSPRQSEPSLKTEREGEEAEERGEKRKDKNEKEKIKGHHKKLSESGTQQAMCVFHAAFIHNIYMDPKRVRILRRRLFQIQRRKERMQRRVEEREKEKEKERKRENQRKRTKEEREKKEPDKRKGEQTKTSRERERERGGKAVQAITANSRSFSQRVQRLGKKMKDRGRSKIMKVMTGKAKSKTRGREKEERFWKEIGRKKESRRLVLPRSSSLPSLFSGGETWRPREGKRKKEFRGKGKWAREEKNRKGEGSKGESRKGEGSKGEKRKGEGSKGGKSKGEGSKGGKSKGEGSKGGKCKGEGSKGEKSKGFGEREREREKMGALPHPLSPVSVSSSPNLVASSGAALPFSDSKQFNRYTSFSQQKADRFGDTKTPIDDPFDPLSLPLRYRESDCIQQTERVQRLMGLLKRKKKKRCKKDKHREKDGDGDDERQDTSKSESGSENENESDGENESDAFHPENGLGIFMFDTYVEAAAIGESRRLSFLRRSFSFPSWSCFPSFGSCRLCFSSQPRSLSLSLTLRPIIPFSFDLFFLPLFLRSLSLF